MLEENHVGNIMLCALSLQVFVLAFVVWDYYVKYCILYLSFIAHCPTKEGCYWQADGENRQTWQLANPTWYP